MNVNSNDTNADESFNFEQNIGFEEVKIKTRPMFLISRRAAVMILIVGYIYLVIFAALLFYVIDAIQKHKEHHTIQIIQVSQAIGIFAIVLAIPIGFSIVRVLRKPELPRPY